MDDPANTHLTGQFGHSSQELINLLLTGVATSNTFDNTVTLGSLKCHGIQSQPSIGYLTQLEALRYCSVGSYYKSPEFPIWIVGSTSHFTVMFGSMDSLKESESDTLLENCRRAFKSVENAEENGFILVNELGTVMAKLDLSLGAGLQTLAAALEMSGSGIILWSDFWKVVSRLKTGASLESVLNTDVSTHQHNEVTSMTTTQYDGSISGAVESDEALAKRLAAEWGSGDVEKSDEEMARELQAQFESENQGNSSSNEVQTTESPQAPAPNQQNGGKRSATMDVETYNSDAFQLHHYNSLRGGELTTFDVTRLSSEEAVGFPVPLTPTNADNNMVSNSDGTHNDLESVVRTKYTSCKFHWRGKQQPSLH
jgi:hypothetical protein